VVTGFRKPESRLYRNFLYLNSNDTINFLSSLHGGDVDQVLLRRADDGGYGFGGGVTAGPIKAEAKRNKNRKEEEEIVLKRTMHSAATTLLQKVHDAKAIGVIEGPYTPEIREHLEENMLLEFKAEIRVHPLHQAVNVLKEFAGVAPQWGLPKGEVRELTRMAQQMEHMFQLRGAKKTLLYYAAADGADTEHKLVLPIKFEHLLVPLDEFAGRATFVAQADKVLGEGEEVLAARIIKDSPVLPAEKEAMLGMLPHLSAALASPAIGIPLDEDDIVLKQPAVILKPLFIYK
jgi:hypothetical protein